MTLPKETPMIERLAEIIAPEWFGDASDMLNNYPDQHIHYQNAAKAKVRAVLTALREPTEVMLQSGGEVLRESVITRTMFAKAVWQAMIDAALNEGEGVR